MRYDSFGEFRSAFLQLPRTKAYGLSAPSALAAFAILVLLNLGSLSDFSRAVVPVLALVAILLSLVGVRLSRNVPRVVITNLLALQWLLLFSGAGISFLLRGSTGPLEFGNILKIAIVTSFINFGAYIWANPKLLRWPDAWVVLAALAPLSILYSAEYINFAWDGSAEENVLTQVLSKRITAGKHGPDYDADLFPLPRFEVPIRVSISRELYNQVLANDEVAITLHSGALGDTWVESIRATGRKGTVPEDAIRQALGLAKQGSDRRDVIGILSIIGIFLGVPIGFAIFFKECPRCERWRLRWVHRCGGSTVGL